jgi:coenzyme PQQ precursor peptide PqqA
VLTTSATPTWEDNMKKWKSPRVSEICVGMEINSYASARA